MNLKNWWKANQVAAVTGMLVLLVVAFPVGSLLKAQVIDPMDCNGDGMVDDFEMQQGGCDMIGDPGPPPEDNYQPPVDEPECFDQAGNPAMLCGDGTCSCYSQTPPPPVNDPYVNDPYGGSPGGLMSDCTAQGGTWCGDFCKWEGGPCDNNNYQPGPDPYNNNYQPGPNDDGMHHCGPINCPSDMHKCADPHMNESGCEMCVPNSVDGCPRVQNGQLICPSGSEWKSDPYMPHEPKAYCEWAMDGCCNNYKKMERCLYRWQRIRKNRTIKLF